MHNITYPTQWQLGKPRGSIKEFPTSYLAIISPPNEKQINKYFLFKDYENSKEKARGAASKYLQKESDKRNLTRNQIRYINKDIIEVKLTQNQIMKTNSKFIDKVQKYPINVSAKKTKFDIKYYVKCQNKKKSFLFTDLICSYEIVEYINGDSLDLR